MKVICVLGMYVCFNLKFSVRDYICIVPNFTARFCFLCMSVCLNQMHIWHTHSPCTRNLQSAGHHALKRKQQDEFVKQHEHEGSAGPPKIGQGYGREREVKNEKPIRPIK